MGAAASQSFIKAEDEKRSIVARELDVLGGK